MTDRARPTAAGVWRAAGSRPLLRIAVLSVALGWQPASAQRPAAPPVDKPFTVMPDALAANHRAQAPYIAYARKTWPAAKARYQAGLPAGQALYLTTRLFDARGRYEQVFIRVEGIEAGIVAGTVANTIRLIEGFALGDSVRFPESDVVDWTIVQADGSEEGNIVGKFMDHYDPAGADAEKPERCSVLVEDEAGARMQELPGLRVADPPLPAVAFELPPGAPATVAAVRCERSSLLPLPHDIQVLVAGYPLALVHGERIGMLEAPEGHLRFRMLQGEMREAEVPLVGAFLDEAQTLLLRQDK